MKSSEKKKISQILLSSTYLSKLNTKILQLSSQTSGEYSYLHPNCSKIEFTLAYIKVNQGHVKVTMFLNRHYELEVSVMLLINH